MNTSLYEVEVLVNGRPIREYAKSGRTFVAAKKGANYSVKIHNHSYFRVMAVLSVDGVGVVDGKEAVDDSPGYIIEARSAVVIEGWRIDLQKVATFQFAEKDEAYSIDAVGSDKNAGVIGVKFFQEEIKPIVINVPPVTYPSPLWPEPSPFEPWKPWKPTWEPLKPSIIWSKSVSGEAIGDSFSCSNSMTRCVSSGGEKASLSYRDDAEPVACAAAFSAAAPDFDIGTGWGKETESPVYTEQFKAIKPASAHIEIFYASFEALEEAGILDKKPKVAFPKSFGGFCKPPRRK